MMIGLILILAQILMAVPVVLAHMDMMHSTTFSRV
jgi:hypothetical protein